MSAVVETLRIARDLVARPGGWTQGVLARDGEGNPCDVRMGACFCASGALMSVGFDEFIGAHRALLRACEPQSIAEFNDAPGRTKAEVVAAFDAAIAAEEARAS